MKLKTIFYQFKYFVLEKYYNMRSLWRDRRFYKVLDTREYIHKENGLTHEEIQVLLKRVRPDLETQEGMENAVRRGDPYALAKRIAATSHMTTDGTSNNLLTSEEYYGR